MQEQPDFNGKIIWCPRCRRVMCLDARDTVKYARLDLCICPELVIQLDQQLSQLRADIKQCAEALKEVENHNAPDSQGNVVWIGDGTFALVENALFLPSVQQALKDK